MYLLRAWSTRWILIETMLSQVLAVIVQTADDFAELVLSTLTEVPDLVFGLAVAVLGWLLRYLGG